MQVLLSLLVFLMQPAVPTATASGPASAAASAPAASSAPAGAAEHERPDPMAGLSTPVRGEEELLGLWKMRQKAVADGDEKRADDLQRQMLVQRKELGIQRLDAVAIALLGEASSALLTKGDAARSQVLVDQARQLAPGLPEIESRQADWSLERQPWALHKWLVFTLKGYVARLDDFQRRTLLLSDLVLTTFVLFALLLHVFLGGQVLRHGLGVYHGLGRTFPGVMKFLLLAAALCLAAIPLYFGFGPLLLIFPFLVLIFSAQGTSERVFSVLFVVFLGGIPWTLRAVDRLSDAGTGVTQALSLLGTNPTHARAAETAMTALRERPSDWAAAAALGLSQKRLGQTDEAIKTLRRAAALVPSATPEAGLVANNLANALFATGRAQSAEKLYLDAIALLPKAPEPYFNLSRLYTRTTQLEKARARFAEASALNPDHVAKWNEDTDLNLNRWVVDLDLSADLLTRRELSTLFAPSSLANRAWLQLAGPVPEFVAPVGCVTTLLAFVVLRLSRKRLRIMSPCSRCALAAEVDLGAAETAPLCEQCHNLFIRNIPVDRRIRFEKEERIARVRTFRLWGLRSAALVLPGLPSFVTGHPLRGMLLTGLVAFLALRLALPEGLLFEPFGGAPPTQLSTAVLAALLGLLWIGGFVRTWRDTRELG